MGYKLTYEQFIIPQDYVFLGLLTFAVIIVFVYDIVKHINKNRLIIELTKQGKSTQEIIEILERKVKNESN